MLGHSTQHGYNMLAGFSFYFSASAINTLGLALNLLGVLGLFRFGMPFHVPTQGEQCLKISQESEEDLVTEERYGTFSVVSLCFVVSGTALQMLSSWL